VPQARHALVVGAGVAGAWAAHELAALGLQVTVLEARQPAGAASGNPAGLVHGTVHPDDGPHARLLRAAALHARWALQAAVAAGVPAQAEGLLRVVAAAEGAAGEPAAAAAATPPSASAPTLAALLSRLGLPPDYVQALDRDQASALAGVPLPGPAWFYPGGGWVAPPDWVRRLLAAPGIALQPGTEVAAIGHSRRADGAGWRALDADGRVLAEAEVLVVAAGPGSAALLAPYQPEVWPLRTSRGQVSGIPYGNGSGLPLRLPVAGDGYALPRVPLPLAGAGQHPATTGLLCGATRQPDDADTVVRDADRAFNLHRLQRLTGLQPAPDAPAWDRAALRLHAEDGLPLAGPLPMPQPPADPRLRLDHARHWPRWPGLFVLTALGARGLTLAPLLGRLVAAQATGTPWPLEQDLADAVDPVRWRVRARRRPRQQAV
jgi:tRNA 5-methylaminomethyl-2-thiouridine biosynthesis bifunctional protein